MILVKTWNFLFVFVLDKMGLEIMFDDHVVKQQAHLDKKIVILHSCHTETCFEGGNPWFWTKIGNFLVFVFVFFFHRISVKKIIVRKQDILDYKNIGFT